MGVERSTTTEKVSTKVTAVVGQVIDAVSAVVRYHTSLFKDDMRTTDLSGYTVVPSYQPYPRSTLQINSLRINSICNALILYSSADTAPLSFLLIATPLLSTGYVS